MSSIVTRNPVAKFNQRKRLQKRNGVIQPITEMFSNDPRLSDLAGWDPLAEAS